MFGRQESLRRLSMCSQGSTHHFTGSPGTRYYPMMSLGSILLQHCKLNGMLLSQSGGCPNISKGFLALKNRFPLAHNINKLTLKGVLCAHSNQSLVIQDCTGKIEAKLPINDE